MERGFTLVIPLYNKVSAVRTTLDSVLHNHGEYPFKCIIVDDDSTDGSSEIGEEYDMKYPDVFQYFKIKHHGSKNPVNARNFGIKLVETEYMGFLDADDELCAGFIDRGCMFLDEHPEYNLYSNGHKIHFKDENGKDGYSTRNYKFTELKTFADCMFAGAQDIHFSSSIYKTKLVKETPFTDVLSEDSVFKLKYINKNFPIYIDNTTCESFVWNTYKSESYKWHHQKTELSFIEEIIQTLNNEIPNMGCDLYIGEDDNLWVQTNK